MKEIHVEALNNLHFSVTAIQGQLAQLTQSPQSPPAAIVLLNNILIAAEKRFIAFVLRDFNAKPLYRERYATVKDIILDVNNADEMEGYMPRIVERWKDVGGYWNAGFAARFYRKFNEQLGVKSPKEDCDPAVLLTITEKVIRERIAEMGGGFLANEVAWFVQMHLTQFTNQPVASALCHY